MDFKKLEYIIAISEEKNLLGASQKMFISSSALSQFVTKLEYELNIPLFKRTKIGWIPTYAGTIYIQMARDILNKKKQTYLELSDIANTKTGRFTVGVTPGRGTNMFSNVFPKFKLQYPHIYIDLVECKIMDLAAMITEGKVDIGFLTSGLCLQGITIEILSTEQILLVLNRNNKLAKTITSSHNGKIPTIDIKLLKDESFTLISEGTSLRSIINRLFEQAGFIPKIIFESSSAMTINNLAKNGFGISFIPSYYADYHKNAVYFHTKPPISWDLLAAYLSGSYLTEAERYFITLVKEYYKSSNNITDIKN